MLLQFVQKLVYNYRVLLFFFLFQVSLEKTFSMRESKALAVRRNSKLGEVCNGLDASLSRFDCHFQVLILNEDLTVIIQFLCVSVFPCIKWEKYFMKDLE